MSEKFTVKHGINIDETNFGDLGTAAAKDTGTSSGNIPLLGSGGKLDTARLDTGTGANQIVQLDASQKLPAVDGSNLTNLSITGGQNNENSFRTIAVTDSNNIVADSTTDTLNVTGAGSVTVTGNSSSDTLTISGTDTITSFTVKDHDGTSKTITNGSYFRVSEGNDIDVDFSATGDGTNSSPFNLAISHKSTSRTNSQSDLNPGFGDDVSVITSVSSNSRGHITDVNTGTVTIPNLPSTATRTDSTIRGLINGGTGITYNNSTGRIDCDINTPGEVGLGNLSNSGNNVAGNFTATGNITAYSDARLKDNVQTIEGALDKVSQMRGVMYDKDGERGTGVIAQEVQQVMPEAVKEGEYLSVAYGNLVGVLIEAIKELKSEIKELKDGSTK